MFFESYYVKEMLAALLIFAIFFGLVAAIVAAALAMEHLRRRLLRWCAVRVARLGLAAQAMLERSSFDAEQGGRPRRADTVVIIVESVQTLS